MKWTWQKFKIIHRRNKRNRIFSMETLNTLVLVSLSLSLFKTQMTVQELENTIENNFNSEEMSIQYDCDENELTGVIICEKKNVIEINDYIEKLNNK